MNLGLPVNKALGVSVTVYSLSQFDTCSQCPQQCYLFELTVGEVHGLSTNNSLFKASLVANLELQQPLQSRSQTRLEGERTRLNAKIHFVFLPCSPTTLCSSSLCDLIPGCLLPVTSMFACLAHDMVNSWRTGLSFHFAFIIAPKTH